MMNLSHDRMRVYLMDPETMEPRLKDFAEFRCVDLRKIELWEDITENEVRVFSIWVPPPDEYTDHEIAKMRRTCANADVLFRLHAPPLPNAEVAQTFP